MTWVGRSDRVGGGRGAPAHAELVTLLALDEGGDVIKSHTSLAVLAFSAVIGCHP